MDPWPGISEQNGAHLNLSDKVSKLGNFYYLQSFILKTWSLTLSLYWTCMKSTLLHNFFPNIDFAPSGLYGPLFAGLVQYYLDIPKGENIGPFGIPVSRKIFVYMVALQVGCFC